MTSTGSLGPNATRKQIPAFEDTEKNLALTSAFDALESLDGKAQDQDTRDNFIRVPSSEVALAMLEPAYEQVEFFKDMMSQEKYESTMADLAAEKAKASEVKGETFITIEKPSKMEQITTIETTGDDPSVEILYSSIPGKVHVLVSPDGEGMKAEGTVLPAMSDAYTEELSGEWNLA